MARIYVDVSVPNAGLQHKPDVLDTRAQAVAEAQLSALPAAWPMQGSEASVVTAWTQRVDPSPALRIGASSAARADRTPPHQVTTPMGGDQDLRGSASPSFSSRFSTRP